MKQLKLLVLLGLISFRLNAQVDSSQHQIHHRLKTIENELKLNPQMKKNYEDLTFYYSQLMKNQYDSLRFTGFKLSAYIDAYYAHYSDKIALGEYQKFPTSAPISDAFSLNMAMVNLQYQNENVTGVLACHTGDIASSAWSAKYNYIQEAHIGVQLIKKLWLEGGYFRTHLGFESIQPRENIGSTIALTTYYEPYFLSGAKLTYFLSPKINIQLNMFNGFNTFVAINNKKTYGFSVGYEPLKNLIISYNTLFSDEAPETVIVRKKRLYNDLYMAYKSNRFDLGFESNFGLQTNSDLEDTTKTAFMYSVTIAGKYKMQNGKYSIYGRAELFDDKNEILTGPVQNAYHQLVGINAVGVNLGLEYKPMPNSFLRVESRYLHLKNIENIFYTNGSFTSGRWETVASMGVWF